MLSIIFFRVQSVCFLLSGRVPLYLWNYKSKSVKFFTKNNLNVELQHNKIYAVYLVWKLLVLLFNNKEIAFKYVIIILKWFKKKEKS